MTTGVIDRLGDRVVLTDDEALALAARAGRPWVSPMPTVAGDQVAPAIERGARSLVVRGLLSPPDGEVLAGHVARLVEPVLEGHVALMTYQAGDDHRYIPGAPTILHHQHRDAWVTEVVTARGVHHLRATDAAWCLRTTALALDDLLRAWVAAGGGGGSTEPPAPMCTAATSVTQGLRVVVAQEGRLLGYDTSYGDDRPTGTGRPLASGDDAVDYLAGTVGTRSIGDRR